MAGVTAVAGFCDAVREFLDLRWKAAPVPGLSPTFENCSLRRVAELANDNEPDAPIIGIVIDRIEVDQGLRNHRQVGGYDVDTEIPLALHLLTFVVPAAPAEARTEQVLGTWLLRELLVHPTFSAAELPPDVGFAADDRVQLHEDPLTVDDARRFWDGLRAPARLTFGWQARAIPVTRLPGPDHAPVLQRRFVDGGVPG